MISFYTPCKHQKTSEVQEETIDTKWVNVFFDDSLSWALNLRDIR